MTLVSDLVPLIRTIDDHIDDLEDIGVELKGNNGILSTVRRRRHICPDC